MDAKVRRSKIYTYFYGKNTVFQQFLIVLGVLLLMLTAIASSAATNGYYKKAEKLYEAYSEAQEAYSEVRSEARTKFSVDYEEYAEIEKGDEFASEKRAYNKALEKMLKAEEKVEKHQEKNPGKSFWSTVTRILAILSLAAGILWWIYKKISFNRDGESEVDEELRLKVAEAKRKGMEKLNIISEQISRVEPVVLTGVAQLDGSAGAVIPTSWAKRIFGRWINMILRFDKIILGLIIAVVYTVIAGFVAKNTFLYVLVLLVALGGAAVGGYFLYGKFETESYVSPRIIKRLTKFPPNFMSKLGSDNGVRVSLPSITVYMFGDDQLYVYYQYLDLVTGRIFYEGVNEYFYEDIVAVTSSQEARKIFKRCGFLNLFLKSIDYLRESITVVSSGCMHSESYIVDMGNSLLDTQFVGMRNLIRQKKAEK